MLKIGDKLYRRVAMAGIFSYVVYEIRRQDKATLYAVRCEQCRDHEPCEVLVTKNGKSNYYKYVCMLNEDIDEDGCSSQRHWHEQLGNRDSYYHPQKISAIKWAYEKSRQERLNSIKEYEGKIESIKTELKKLDEWFKDIEATEQEARREGEIDGAVD